MAGLYAINARQSIKSIDELLSLARDSGYRCQVLQNTLVFNWGPVAGPEGTVQVPGAKPVTILEVIEPDGAPDKHYFLIAKTR